MGEKQAKQKPGQSGEGKAKADDKQARLAQALRANLRRRKEQARDRRDDDT
jgi:hypothetical protein